MSDAAMVGDDRDLSADAIVGRLFEAAVGAFDLLSVVIGDRLGLYGSLKRDGSATSGELATRAGIAQRYAREWLEQQAASGILLVDDPAAAPDQRRFTLPPGHAEALTDPESPYSIAPVARAFAACAGVLPQLLDAYRSGGGVEWSDYGRDMIEAQGDFNRPWLVGSLGTEYLPSIPDLHEALLRPGAAVADVACGVGWAAISLARAYPNITVDGFDLDEASIEIASRNAKEAGVADRVRFEARDAADPALQNRYDLAMVVEAIHDLSQPVAVLSAIRDMLKPGGTLIVADERTDDAFNAPASEMERLFYTYSVLACLPTAMDDPTSAATGTVMRRATFEGYAKQAGFGRVFVLPIDHDFLRFYRLDR